MITHNLGYPRIGAHRELKKANESYWAGKITAQELEQTAKNIRLNNWYLQKDAGIDIIPCNDFTFYDHVLDTCLMTGAIPARYHDLLVEKQLPQLDLQFAMARGFQKEGLDVTAMEMTKWFDTNYHYIVPEFAANQQFSLFSEKVISQYHEAKRAGFEAKPVILGPVSFLLLGKEKEKGFHRLQLLSKLLPVYLEVLRKLDELDAHYIQFDEPCLSLNLGQEERDAITSAYTTLQKAFPQLHFILASYFECYGENLQTVLQLPVQTLHLDLVRCPSQLEDILATNIRHTKLRLSLGVVDGRNIWKNDFDQSLALIRKAQEALSNERLLIAPSCSLLHVPCDLDLETDENNLPAVVKSWMAFAKQKLDEVKILADLAGNTPSVNALQSLKDNQAAMADRRTSSLIHRPAVVARTAAVSEDDARRTSAFPQRKQLQQEVLHLPKFPTTTIGSFPQTATVRSWRTKWKKGELTAAEYDTLIKEETAASVRWQESIGMDVLVHGEFERNDMVEYFGEQLEGFVFTQYGWVQSYGSRCVKPPVIVGDVARKAPMTVYYTQYAQSLTDKPVKGMLTGPVTILQWSFVRNDQPRATTCLQIALAIRDEVHDLEEAGIRVIQIDEPALREGLPLRHENWDNYLQSAVKAFRVASSGVTDKTQIHTHMCYAEFNDIFESIAALDADVITIETSRSQSELLEGFAHFKYPNDIGPGVYDIHSPRIPSEEEMVHLMEQAMAVIPAEQLWVNPDCGLKTRDWPETKAAVAAMVAAAKTLRSKVTA
ncbi:5-methyltetrahydropteroyltriglutamate--homocysteine methyltransferase [Chitinophaga dinghuensis]|uniref:5-methyltetrahydropteroyltriglutamate--homocysteine methyltransferase n=1 Tax=Chitinophaga dinghuensis TaxID=1539050 RepID=A0A327W0D5_9BACT|nr:5-methyltetrahydropteroyltriglutamate--homocysteine S-methyltransferase [Chitinophaga dinghuensis]RAJ82222.1 5-methyltetrahydropteroyltriglutamate--homocysteine methyltransferase [Chitinophaga dinghuensis]